MNISSRTRAFLATTGFTTGQHQGLTIEAQGINQFEHNQVLVCGRVKQTGTDSNQSAVITSVEISRSSEETFQEIKVLRAEALRLSADH